MHVLTELSQLGRHTSYTTRWMILLYLDATEAEDKRQQQSFELSICRLDHHLFSNTKERQVTGPPAFSAAATASTAFPFTTIIVLCAFLNGYTPIS